MNETKTPDAWPLLQFSFRLTIDGWTAGFQEVSGLDADTDVLDDRAGNSRLFSTVKMPGMQKVANVTLKRGLMSNDHAFWDWHKAIKMNTVARKPVTISLVDETGMPTMTWTLRNAFPIKITGSDLKAKGNDVAVETLELAHEGLEISNG